MSAHALAALARPRIPLLAALLALAALAVAVLAPPTSAAPPDDLTLTLSLIEDSDNIVPAGGTLQLRAALSSTTQDPEALDISGTLRVSGDQEWEHNGRSSYSVATQYTSPSPNDASTGWVVAVQERTAAEGGDIVVVGARHDDVVVGGNTIDKAGSVDIFINGKYVQRLTAPTPVTAHRYGQSVAVGGGYIVVGAHGPGTAAVRSAVYIYNTAGELQATLTPTAAVVTASSNSPMFGTGVAISDDGNTIAVAGRRGYNGQRFNGAVYIFTKAAGADWVDADSSAAAAVTGLQSGASRESGREPGAAVAISGDGTVVAVGAPFRDTDTSHNPPGSTIGAAHNSQNGGVLVFVKPDTGWASSESPTARLLADDDIFRLRLGGVIDINYDGSVIVANGNGRYGDVIPGAVNRISGGTPVLVPEANAWAGAAYVWVKEGAWTDESDGVKLTDADGEPGDLFGHKVAISDSGNRVIVSNAWKSANNFRAGEAHIFDKPAGGWADDNEADIVLTSPQSEEQLFFGFGVAIDGENTVVVAQNENIDFLSQIPGTPNIFTGHGRAYGFDLAAANPQASAMLLDGEALPCSSRLLDGTTTWTCPVDLDTTAPGQLPMITIPAGTPDGAFTISANFAVDGKENISAILPVMIGTVNEADHAEFDFAQDPGDPTITGDPLEKPYPSAIPAGKSTRLQLRILNSGDMPAAANAVSAVLFTTNMGSLRLLSPLGATTGACDLTCQVDVSKLNAANSGNIVVELTHPGAGKSGTATVRAQVLPGTGGGQLPVDAVTVTLSGPAAKLTISEPATGVLNINTATGDDDAAETRDRLRFSVSAADASGNEANVPTAPRSTLIKGPDGAIIWRSSDANNTNFAVAWPLKKAGATAGATVDDKDPAGNLQVELDVNAPAAAPLANGEYTLEVTAGAIKAAQTFTVSGGPESISFGEPDGELRVGEQFTLPVTLADAAGAAVPDGTTVTFTLTPTGALPVLVELRKKTTTTDGQASVTYQVISAGRASVRVSSGDAGDVAVISTTDLPAEPAGPVNPADSLSPKMPNEYSTWLGEGTTTASALLDGLNNGIDTILLWRNGEWLRYGVLDGRRIPGAMDFEVTRGAILWLGSAN